MDKLKEADWIALRLLYILMASDPSVGGLPDVQKTINHYNAKLRPKGRKHRYSGGHLLPVFALLNKEIPYDGETFANPEVSLTRNVETKMHYSEAAFDEATQHYPTPDEVKKEMEK